MKKILVIEDEMSLLENISIMLEIRGFDVLKSTNGKNGVILAFDNEPDLIICDINMPEMDGFQVLDIIRANPATKLIPFIFLTARTGKDDIRRGMNLGADDYISKPFTEADLISTVTSRLGKHQALSDTFNENLDSLCVKILENMPCDMKAPLDNIQNYSAILSEEYLNGSTKNVKEYSDKIYSSALELKKRFNNYFSYISLLDYKFPKFIPPEAYARNANAILLKVIARTEASYPDMPEVKYTPLAGGIKMQNEHFEQVVAEVLDNAFKFTKGKESVVISHTVSDTILNLTISNVGLPFSNAALYSISGFSQFNKTLFEEHSLSLGLAIAKRILSLYDGSMNIEHKDGCTGVTLRMPVWKN